MSNLANWLFQKLHAHVKLNRRMDITMPLNEMTAQEKLRAMEALWESLSRCEQDVPVPQWHKAVLDERQQLIKEGKARFIDWDTARKEIRKRTK